MEKVNFKPGTMLNPVPVVMVSCGTEAESNIITIAWTGIVNSDPPMTYVSVRKSRHSHHIIKERGEFVINLATEDLAFATDYCGVKSGKDIDKFKEQNLTKGKGKKVSCPTILESPVNLECKVKEIIQYPSHDMFIGEIVNVQVNKQLIDPSNRIMLDAAKLICYNHGEYFGIQRKPLGRFGHAVMKTKTKRRIASKKGKKPYKGKK
ncbi:MAG: flavin reductase family protein [Anaerovoracaceae bacterium]